MDENNNNQQETQQEPQQDSVQQTTEQPIQEKPKGLMPGQDHEDELDYMGGALFAIVKNGFDWIKSFFVPKKVE